MFSRDRGNAVCCPKDDSILYGFVNIMNCYMCHCDKPMVVVLPIDREILYHMSRDMKKLVFGVFDQA